MDRKLYKIPFKLGSSPDWQCPNCSKGLLRIKEGTFFREELSDSKKPMGTKHGTQTGSNIHILVFSNAQTISVKKLSQAVEKGVLIGML